MNEHFHISCTNQYSHVYLQMSKFEQNLTYFDNRFQDQKFHRQINYQRLMEVTFGIDFLPKSPHICDELPELKDKISLLRTDYERKLISTAKKICGLAKVVVDDVFKLISTAKKISELQLGKQRDDIYFKAKRLLYLAKFCLAIPILEEDFKQELITLIPILSQILDAEKMNQKLIQFRFPDSFAQVNDQIMLYLLGCLDAISIGRMSQVSRKFSYVCNNESLWEDICKKKLISIDLNKLRYNNQLRRVTYKEIYKTADFFQRHNDQPEFELISFNIDKSITDYSKKTTYCLLLDVNSRKLSLHHIKEMIKIEALRNNPGGFVQPNTSLADIHIHNFGKHLRDDEKISALHSDLQDAPCVCLIKSPKQASQASASTESIAHYTASINKTASHIKTDEKMVKEFLARGGVIQILEGDQTLSLNRDHRFIVADNHGMGISQATRAFLIKNDCYVELPISSEDSGMNPEAEYTASKTPYYSASEAHSFKEACGCDKVPVLGQVELKEIQDPESNKNWFQTYFDDMKAEPPIYPPVHFLCYSSGAGAVMRRLLAKKGDLKGFILTFIPWTDDIIKDPTKPGITEFSKEAYQDLLNKLQKRIRIES